MNQTSRQPIDMIRMPGKVANGICLCLILAVFAILAIYADIRSDNPNTLLITEVCSTNDSTAHDEFGNYGADYIELYNGTNESINLGGYGLSDSRTDLYRFVLPDIEIAPHAFVVVWSDDKEQDLTSYAADYVIEDVHGMTFSISSKGENIYLTSPKGRIVDQITVAANIADGYSYQTALEDPDDYIVGEASLYSVAEHLDEIVIAAEHEVDSPTFSVDGGWYDEPITVELFSTQGDIYYTLDGSEPDENSIKYERPITVTNRSNEPNVYSAIDSIAIDSYVPTNPVDKCTVIKAIAIDGEECSDVVARSYFVGLDSKAYENVAVISLTVDPEDLFGYEDGIYVLGEVYDQYAAMFGASDAIYHTNYGMEGRGWEREAQIEFYTSDHEEALRQEIGIRIHGGWSVKYNQKGFNLYAREEYDGNDMLQYAFYGKDYSRLMLRAGGYRDVYATKIRDVFIQSLVSDRAIGCQQAMPCVLFLNGEYWGLYNLQEQVSEAYIEANYGIDAEDVVVLKNPWDLVGSDENAQAYMDIVDYADTHDLSDGSNYAWIEERIDIQSYIDFYCTEIYVANCDAIANNYAIWRSTELTDDEYGDGRWRWLLYDMDDSAGMVEGRTEADTDSFVSGHWTTDPLGENGDILFSALMENDAFKDRFVSTFLEVADTNFDYDRVHALLYEVAEEYCDAVVASQQRFRGEISFKDYLAGADYSGWYSEDDFWCDVKVIDDFYRERRDYIVNYLYQDLGIQIVDSE